MNAAIVKNNRIWHSGHWQWPSLLAHQRAPSILCLTPFVYSGSFVGTGRNDFVNGIDNETIDFSQLESFVHMPLINTSNNNGSTSSITLAVTAIASVTTTSALITTTASQGAASSTAQASHGERLGFCRCGTVPKLQIVLHWCVHPHRHTARLAARFWQWATIQSNRSTSNHGTPTDGLPPSVPSAARRLGAAAGLASNGHHTAHGRHIERGLSLGQCAERQRTQECRHPAIGNDVGRDANVQCGV